MDATLALSPLIAALIDRQRDEGWLDEQMSDELGMSRSYWNLLRTGEKPLTLGVAQRAVKRFPEYKAVATQSLMGDEDA